MFVVVDRDEVEPELALSEARRDKTWVNIDLDTSEVPEEPDEPEEEEEEEPDDEEEDEPDEPREVKLAEEGVDDPLVDDELPLMLPEPLNC